MAGQRQQIGDIMDAIQFTGSVNGAIFVPPKLEKLGPGTYRVVLKGDLIRGQFGAVDANFLLQLPSGDGIVGGTFESVLLLQ
jgi:hypothetical protein